VDLKTIGEFLKAGCVAVGAGSSLISKDVLENDDWATLTKTAAAFVQAARSSR
jgi:2-dehydro-3-deoxyphosphogluconate aldolase/(4S)-4-hydroxy-2-oxoglutarate aldolase